MVKKIVLDTDIGIDCDDAVALALLLEKHVKKECELILVTTCSTRDGATETVKAICNYYNAQVDIGAMATPKLLCDDVNTYATAVKTKFCKSVDTVDAVKLLRKKLSSLTEKVTFIAIGPLVNVRRFLESAPDEISNKSGLELAREKIEALYVMGGSFTENYDILGKPKSELFAEWNILQDIKSAQMVTENFPNDIYFIPWEAGFEVYSNMGVGNNPVWYAMEQHAIYLGADINGYKRDSWDPVTCLLATENCDDYFCFSPSGKVTIDNDGVTKFISCEGKSHILLLKKQYKEIASVINSKLRS